MALTIQQKSNAADFPKPAELIEITGTSGLEAQDRVLMNVLYRHAHDSGGLAKPGARWSIPMAELNIGKHEGLGRVRQSLRRLLGIQVTVTYKNDAGLDRVLQTILFSHFDTPLSGPGNLIFGIPEEFRAILAKSGRWGRIKAEVVHAMSSKYAIALYEQLRLRANMDNSLETFALDRFRALLGVPPGTYGRGDDFFKKVIEPAVLEVNGLSELGCKIDLVRVHSRASISKIVLAWWKKDADENRSAMKELNRSKLGRKARLRGKFETVTPYQTDIEDFT